MAREIKKKSIDEDLLDQQSLDELLDQPSAGGMGEQEEKETRDSASNAFTDLDAFDSPGSQGNQASSLQRFSLDVFELPDLEGAPGAPLQKMELEDDKEPAPVEDAPQVPPARRLATRKLLIVSSLGLLLVSAVSFGIWRWLAGSPQGQPQQVVTMIRHPITIPFYQESIDFLLVGNAREEKSIITVGIEFEFRSPGRYKQFQDENVLFRDVIYRFLEGQHPTKNTLKHWQPIVQNDLLAHLKATMPQSQADQVRITRLERL